MPEPDVGCQSEFFRVEIPQNSSRQISSQIIWSVTKVAFAGSINFSRRLKNHLSNLGAVGTRFQGIWTTMGWFLHLHYMELHVSPAWHGIFSLKKSNTWIQRALNFCWPGSLYSLKTDKFLCGWSSSRRLENLEEHENCEVQKLLECMFSLAYVST